MAEKLSYHLKGVKMNEWESLDIIIIIGAIEEAIGKQFYGDVFMLSGVLRKKDVQILVHELDTLTLALKSSAPLVRGLAAELLAKLGDGAAPVFPALTRALEDEDTFVRVRAAQALCAAKQITPEVVAVLRGASIPGKANSDAGKLAKEILRTIDPSVLQKFPQSSQETRVVVGECEQCHRPLRVRAYAVKSEMRLTCKCGHSSVIHMAPTDSE